MLQWGSGNLPFPMYFMFCSLMSSCNQILCHTPESDCANVASKWLSQCSHCIQNLIKKKKNNLTKQKATTQTPDFCYSVLRTFSKERFSNRENWSTYKKIKSVYFGQGWNELWYLPLTLTLSLFTNFNCILISSPRFLSVKCEEKITLST